MKKNKDSSSKSSDYVVRPMTEKEKEVYIIRVKEMYDTLLLKRHFNGSIIVAKNGEIILEDYHGYADFASKDTITPNTTFHLASVTKTFTATAILKLWEEKKLNIDDSIQVSIF